MFSESSTPPPSLSRRMARGTLKVTRGMLRASRAAGIGADMGLDMMGHLSRGLDRSLQGYMVGKADECLNSFEAHCRSLAEVVADAFNTDRLLQGLSPDKRGKR